MKEILIVPHPKLRQKSKALNKVTKEDVELSKKMISKGATILGGCCETKPFHIEKISSLKN